MSKKSQETAEYPMVIGILRGYNFIQHSGLKGREVRILHGPAAVNREKLPIEWSLVIPGRPVGFVDL